MSLNKSTKIWLNYIFGGIISIVLLWSISRQVIKQLAKIGTGDWWQTGDVTFLYIGLAMVPINMLLEAKKWHLLAKSAQPLSFKQAFASFLAGIAISTVTPNRLGEYPGRIIYLKQKNTLRLIGVSLLGVTTQLLTLFIFGLIGLVYYNIVHPGVIEKVVLICALFITLGIAIIFWSFERWEAMLERVTWLRRFRIYGQLLKRFSLKEQLTILGISMLRFSVYTAQYLILLYWMNITIPPLAGFCMAALFFWVMAIIPSIALAELGERGQVSIYLFGYFTQNVIGILSATIIIWLINLMIPAIIGSFLLLRMRFLR